MNRRVVITGMGAVTPVGIGVEAFWNNLLAGKNGIKRMTLVDPTPLRSSLAGEVADFDPEKYQTPKDASHTDRCGQFALAAAIEAIEASQVVGAVDPFRIAVYFGTGVGGFETMEINCRKLVEKGPRRVSPFFVPMIITNMPASLIATRYGFWGQSIPVVTACASGTHAIGEAMRAIRHGYADVVVAGGCEAPIVELGIAGFNSMKALATTDNPNEASLPFDARRSGFVPSEGAGALVLEEYESAKGRGAKIYGEIVGYGMNSDSTDFVLPNAERQAECIQKALRNAELAPDEIDIVNTHATATTAGDILEIEALRAVFGESKKTYVNNTKSFIGHAMGAAGALELAGNLPSFDDGIVHPTINVDELDPECEIDNLVLNEPKEIGNVRFILNNSFGMVGINAVTVIAKYEGD